MDGYSSFAKDGARRKKDHKAKVLRRPVHKKKPVPEANPLVPEQDSPHDSVVKKQRLNSETDGFSEFVRSHLWNKRRELDPPWPYRGASACDFFQTVYADWLDEYFISQRDLAQLDPKLTAQIQQELNQGRERPTGLVSEYNAQVLEIDDEIEQEVTRRIRARAAEERRKERANKASIQKESLQP